MRWAGIPFILRARQTIFCHELPGIQDNLMNRMKITNKFNRTCQARPATLVEPDIEGGQNNESGSIANRSGDQLRKRQDIIRRPVQHHAGGECIEQQEERSRHPE